MHKKGFTMVELAVSLAIAGVFFASLLAVLVPVYRTYQRTRAQADALLIASNVVDAMRTTANIATELTAEDDTVKVGSRIVYSAQDGILLCQIDSDPAKPVFDESYYNGKSIQLSASPAGENVVSVTVTVSAANMQDATVTAILSPLRNVLS